MKNYKKSRGQSFTAVLYALVFVAVGFFLAAAQTQAANGTLTGIVKDSSGVLANQWVDIFDGNTANPDYTHGYVTSVQTNASGVYTATLPEGVEAYRVAVLLNSAYVAEWYNNKVDSSVADKITITAGGTTTLDDIVLVTADTSGSISGTVTDSSPAAIPGVVVYAWNSTGGAQTATTDATGYYKITGLQPGNYKVEFFANSAGYITKWYNNQTTKDAANPVPVTTDNETQNINATLDAGGSISGKVTVGSPTGPAIQNAWVDVCAYPSTECNSSSPTWKGYAKTDINGEYTAGGLPKVGTYIVQFHEKTVQNAGAGATQFYDKQTAIGSATAVPYDTSGRNAVFTGATIIGTVLNSDLAPIKGVVVTLYNSSGNVVATSSPTLDDGTYTFTGLLRGDYKLYFNASATLYASEWYHDIKTTIDDATPVSVLSVVQDAIILIDTLDRRANLVPVYNLLLMKKRTP
jgi:hypothetical protein